MIFLLLVVSCSLLVVCLFVVRCVCVVVHCVLCVACLCVVRCLLLVV